MIPTNRSRSHRGFSIIEMIAVIAVLAGMCLIGAGMSSSALTFVKVKGSAEQLLWDIRSIHQFTIARGNFPVPGTGGSGIKFFANRVNATHDGVDTTPGFSYVVYGANPRNHILVAKPAGAMAAAAPYLPFVRNFPAGVTVLKAVATPVLNTDVIEFTFAGDLAAGSVGTVIISGADTRPFTITMWGESAGGLPYQRPRSIVLQAP